MKLFEKSLILKRINDFFIFKYSEFVSKNQNLFIPNWGINPQKIKFIKT